MIKKKIQSEKGKIKENINRKLDIMSEEEKVCNGTWEKMKGDARDRSTWKVNWALQWVLTEDGVCELPFFY